VTGPFFTIGHSDHTLERLTGLLHDADVEMVVDVRRFPGSRSNPQFDEDVLLAALPPAGLRYRRAAGLGGRRPATKAVPPTVNGLWRNRSFHNYADHALSDEFREALSELREQGLGHRVAVMCAEAVWWRCHRRIIADHLLAHGDDVSHIMPGGRIEKAELTPGAIVHTDHTVTYPTAAERR
jgi:uncharacterized protein (DUF488 family)